MVVRADGRPTYYALDVAYHYDKLQRADRVIDILRPDHPAISRGSTRWPTPTGAAARSK